MRVGIPEAGLGPEALFLLGLATAGYAEERDQTGAEDCQRAREGDHGTTRGNPNRPSVRAVVNVARHRPQTDPQRITVSGGEPT